MAASVQQMCIHVESRPTALKMEPMSNIIIKSCARVICDSGQCEWLWREVSSKRSLIRAQGKFVPVTVDRAAVTWWMLSMMLVN